MKIAMMWLKYSDMALGTQQQKSKDGKEQKMDPVLGEKFRVILTEQLERLLAQAKESLSELASDNTQEIEYLDRAMAQSNQAMKLRIRSRESRLIKKLRLAIERIDAGVYGECELCGEPISLKRLEARPVTTKCIDCKEEEERLETLSQHA